MCHADVSDRVAVEAMIASIMDGFHRRLDIVVANAYYSKRQPLLEQVTRRQFMGELTAQVRISEFSKKEDCKT